MGGEAVTVDPTASYELALTLLSHTLSHVEEGIEAPLSVESSSPRVVAGDELLLIYFALISSEL